MRLSHRKKVASKQGIYWPSRTKQAREQREAMQRYAIKIAQSSTAFYSTVNHVVQVCHAMRRGIQEASKELKAWLLPRDSSQQKVNALCKGHAVKISALTPRNDKNL